MDIREIAAAGLLAVNTIADVRERKILMIPTALAFLTGLFTFSLTVHGSQAAELLPGLLPGTILLLLSVVTRGEIGMGDGLFFLALGSLLPLYEFIGTFLLTFFLAGIAGAVFFLRKCSGRKAFPLIPYACAAWILAKLILILSGGG
ncbi:MAG: prepilin peptidase [Lachnospiraceae bacterium]|nr:prepilin peptidase [Lachnospiraceae bacterium]